MAKNEPIVLQGWCCRVRLKGEHGEVEIEQQTDTAGTIEVREHVLENALKLYKELKATSTEGKP